MELLGMVLIPSIIRSIELCVSVFPLLQIRAELSLKFRYIKFSVGRTLSHSGRKCTAGKHLKLAMAQCLLLRETPITVAEKLSHCVAGYKVEGRITSHGGCFLMRKNSCVYKILARNTDPQGMQMDV